MTRVTVEQRFINLEFTITIKQRAITSHWFLVFDNGVWQLEPLNPFSFSNALESRIYNYNDDWDYNKSTGSSVGVSDPLRLRSCM